MRAATMLDFYKVRLPRYAFVREAFSYFLMAASAAGSIIAFVWDPSYVAILTSVTAGVMSWMEFTSVSKKLSRYNSSVVKLEGIILWWESLSAVDRASVVKIGELVYRAGHPR
uniref:SMODS and SLOG-associating 2TM effector domain-containing protein n=1 Tax=Hemiselmis andersenii TaxID=464988 RepID=A0A7S1HP90_HEMAN|mmetsp:Transcript_9822/g.24025  ORF Transcript_9822/g.24025 Transcript_9822/m.24025 type:complete len:113 (+) Transcript_9822:350-688(+)